MTGTNRDRPGLRETLAACHPGDTLVVNKLGRLARDIADELTARQVKLSFAGSMYDPSDPIGDVQHDEWVCQSELAPAPP